MSIFDALGSVAGMSGSFGGAGLGLEAIGAAGSIFSGLEASKSAGQIAGYQGQIAQDEVQVQKQRQLQMNLTTQRQQMENLRNVQRSRASGLSTAAGSGAQFGSGLAGQLGAASAQGATNSLNLSQNNQIGNSIFNTQYGEDYLKTQIAAAQGTESQWQGIGQAFSGLSSLGGGMVGGAKSFGQIFGNNNAG